MNRALEAFSVALLALLAGCSTLAEYSPFREVPRRIKAEHVPEAIETAREALAQGEDDLALDWMRTARKTRGLSTDVLNEIQEVIEAVVTYRIQLLDTPEGDPDDLVDLLDLDLPRQLAVTGGIVAARRLYEDDRRMTAFDVIETLDRKYPTHHERAAAGKLCADIGLSLAEYPGRFLGIWLRWGRAIKVLEYLVMHYPIEPRCDLAYAELAALYERDRRWELAIERHEDLIKWHLSSPLVPYSEAQIPHLRLVRIESPEYDRAALIQARRELEFWLTRHSDSELAPGVQADLEDCLQRLAESDLQIAGFYDRVGCEAGRTRHAERAVDEARAAGDTDREARAEDLLAAPAPGRSAALPAPVTESGEERADSDLGAEAGP